MILNLEESKREFLENNNGIYKFYVNEDLLNKIKDKLKLNCLDNRFIETIIYKGNIYYCVYVGQCNRIDGFYGRINDNHLKGDIDHSTLRNTLLGILEINEDELTNILNDSTQCLFVVFELSAFKEVSSNKIDKKVIKSLERKMINSSIHILNIDDNDFYNANMNIFGNNCNFSKSAEILSKLRKIELD